jgi:hypothetical protein
MIKKLVITVLVAVLFLAVGILVAQENLEKPGNQPQKARQVQQKRRPGSGAQKARKKAGVKTDSRKQGQKPAANRPAGQQMNRVQMFQRWFGGLKKAHREKDMEKVGQLIRTMEQRQQQMRNKWQGQVKMQNNRRHRQRAMNRPRAGRRRWTRAKSNYRSRDRLCCCCRKRAADRNFNESYRNRRPRPTGRDRSRPEWRRYRKL